MVSDTLEIVKMSSWVLKIKTSSPSLQLISVTSTIIISIHTLPTIKAFWFRIVTDPFPFPNFLDMSRKLGNGNGSVTILNQKALIVGNVCMDMIMVDVTDINCKEGDDVFIFKTQEDILTISNVSETISYEILTMISQRIKRLQSFYSLRNHG